MQIVASTILALFGAAAALPSRNIQARDGITVTFYPEANFGGEPVVVSDIAADQCQSVPAEIAGNVGSIQVANGALCRITYHN
ncbi:hypothetical protein N0V90_000816 [Kalmusia sp. IMI 367209]|nr:hypothetical protein N0V90_000816 [Kalmusia sp. IMI 367209]